MSEKTNKMIQKILANKINKNYKRKIFILIILKNKIRIYKNLLMNKYFKN